MTRAPSDPSRRPRRPRRRGSIWAASLAAGAAALLSAAPPSAAEEPEKNAEELFQDAMKLMEQGEFARACPMLAESQRSEPRVGTLLWLGYCFAAEGKPKAARDRYLEAEAAAQATGDPREQTAREEAAKLAAKVPKLRLELPKTAGLELLIDGESRALPAPGEAIDLEVGDREIRVEAPNHAPYKRVVRFDAGELVDVVVPPFGRAEAGPTEAAAARARDHRPWLTGRRLVGLGLAGGGVVAAGVGAGLFFSAKGTLRSLTDECGGQNCPRAKADELSSGKTRQIVGDIAMIGGGVLFGVGAVVFLTAPSEWVDPVQARARGRTRPSIRAEVGPRAVTVDVRF